ncbi:collagen alpha-1(XII) chain-like isoform X3, partial [Paramuricea clavata]
GPEIYKTERTSRSLKVFWNHVSASINHYKVSYIKFTSEPYTNCTDKVTKVAGEINNAVLDGLQPYTEYTVAVKAFEDDGKALGEWGEAVTVKTSCEKEKECPNNAICLNGNCVCKDGYIFDDHSECKRKNTISGTLLPLC